MSSNDISEESVFVYSDNHIFKHAFLAVFGREDTKISLKSKERDFR